jgi:ubiquinol-cytochrome c reductase cytochrome b subunit
LGLEEEMPGGTSFAYIFGSSVLVIFLLQVVMGIWQLFYFVPTIDHAYESLSYFRLEVSFGWLIHGLHRWGANAMIILIGLHMSRVFIWGAYKHPRQLTWLMGVGLLLSTLALGFTGPVLPWDQKGYWEAEVGTSIAGTAPVIGSLIVRLLRGSAEMGQSTLSRFFVLHVIILPAVLLALIGLHVIAFRNFGISGPWHEAKRKRIGLFWPDQVFRDALFITSIFVILVGLCAYIPLSFSGPLDLLATSYTPKPEWYFLFLYQSLKAFHGRLEPIGTVGIPLFVTLLLVLLPFLDRNPERNPARRPFVMGSYLVFVILLFTLGLLGYLSKPGVSTVRGIKTVSSSPDPSIQPTRLSASAERGAQLFHSFGCIGCHAVHGAGGTIGPDLSSGVLKGKTRQWLVTQIRDPKKNDPTTVMPPFSSASDQQVNDVVDYLLTLESEGKPVGTPSSRPRSGVPSHTHGEAKGQATQPQAGAPGAQEEQIGPHGFPEKAASIIGNADLGAVTFKNICEACHGPRGTDRVPNPGSDDGTVPPLNPIDRLLFNDNAQTFANQIDRLIQHGSIPKGPNPRLEMLPFGDENTLTQAQIANVEAYVLKLNGVSRAQLVHPGISPKLFFWLVLIVFGLLALASGGFWMRMNSRMKRKTP